MRYLIVVGLLVLIPSLGLVETAHANDGECMHAFRSAQGAAYKRSFSSNLPVGRYFE